MKRTKIRRILKSLNSFTSSNLFIEKIINIRAMLRLETEYYIGLKKFGDGIHLNKVIPNKRIISNMSI